MAQSQRKILCVVILWSIDVWVVDNREVITYTTQQWAAHFILRSHIPLIFTHIIPSVSSYFRNLFYLRGTRFLHSYLNFFFFCILARRLFHSRKIIFHSFVNSLGTIKLNNEACCYRKIIMTGVVRYNPT